MVWVCLLWHATEAQDAGLFKIYWLLLWRIKKEVNVSYFSDEQWYQKVGKILEHYLVGCFHHSITYSLTAVNGSRKLT